MKRIDTHQHLWDLRQFPCSWCAGIPALNRSFLLDDYRTAAKDTGIDKTVFVECDVDEPHAVAEAQHVQKLAENNPLIAGIVAAARLERTDFPAQLEALLNLSRLRGIRRVLHVVPDAVSQPALFAENVRRLAAHHLTFDLCVLARQLPLGIALAKKCPDVQFVLDHCGVPEVKGKAFDPWRAHIKQLGMLPNVACKISGLVAYAGENWTVDDLRPWVDHVVACFGWNRVVWGGDWPVCNLTASLKQWVEATDALFSAATESQREALFHKNAERIYHV
ncbi:MAG TPA: amidohydrolase [Verrucomicrobiae bacterium]|nr:amidohydrolase [Verrucomicrobiae bacterium]